MTPEVQYARKKKTLADAQALIQSGDVIAVSGAITEPVVFLNHLSDIIPTGGLYPDQKQGQRLCLSP